MWLIVRRMELRGGGDRPGDAPEKGNVWPARLQYVRFFPHPCRVVPKMRVIGESFFDKLRSLDPTNMANLTQHATSIATTAADYRKAELVPFTADHVMTWAGQFDEDDRLPLLAELDHVLTKTYFSADTV